MYNYGRKLYSFNIYIISLIPFDVDRQCGDDDHKQLVISRVIYRYNPTSSFHEVSLCSVITHQQLTFTTISK